MQFGPGFTATFLYYFVSTTILFTLVSTQALDLGIGTGIPQQVGILAGLIAGLMGAYFNQTKTIAVNFDNKQTFLKNLDQALSQIGYQQASQTDDLIIYERPGLGKFVAGKVYVQVHQESATIATRSVQLKRIQKQVT
jgi:hypothetical protein